MRLLEEQRQQLSAVSSERENEVARRTLELSKVVEEREQRLIARRSLTSPEQKDLDELDEKYFLSTRTQIESKLIDADADAGACACAGAGHGSQTKL